MRFGRALFRNVQRNADTLAELRRRLGDTAFGAAFDRTGSYDGVLMGSFVGLVLGALAFLTLGRYREFPPETAR